MSDSHRIPELQRASRRYPWGIYFFLMAVFFFAQPFDLFHSVRYLTRADQDVYTNSEKIKSGNIGRRCALFSLSGFAIVSLLRAWRNRLRINGVLGFLILFFGIWVFSSIAWAEDFSFTARKVLVFGMLCLGALSIAERFSFHEIIVFAFFSGSLSLLIGFLCEIKYGTFRPLQQGYRFCGQMGPIQQAYGCGMTIVAALILSRTAGRARPLFIASALVAAVFMLITRSRGPMVSATVAVIIYWSLLPNRHSVAAYSLAGVIASILMYFAFGDDISIYTRNAILLGRKTSNVFTLTGRVQLWKECLPYAYHRPLLGYGYDSFWTPDRYNNITAVLGKRVPDVHNALIDLTLGLGIIGAGVSVLILVLAVKRSVEASRDTDYAFAVALLILYAANNLLVSMHLSPSIPTFVVMVVIAKLGFVRAVPRPQLWQGN